MNTKSSVRIWIVILTLTLLTLACGLQKEKAPAEAPAQATAPSQSSSATEAPSDKPDQPSEPATAVPTITPAPIVTPLPKAQPLELVDFGFGQEDTYLGFGFLVKNPNTDYMITDSEYTMLAYDASNVVIASYTGYLDYLAPGQTLGIGNDYYLDEGDVVDHIDIKLQDGDAEKPVEMPVIGTKNVYLSMGEYMDEVLGEAVNSSMEMSDTLTLYALLYDDAGKIVGGGYSYLDFIPAMDSTGFFIIVHGSNTATRADVYPAFYSLSGWGDKSVPQDAKGLEILKLGSASDDYSTSYAFTVNNPNTAYDLKDSRYIITAYDADDKVVDVSSGYINYSLAGQKTGIAGTFYTYDQPKIDHIKVQVANGDYKAAANPPWFTTASIEYSEGTYSSEVNAVVANNFAKDAENVMVYAVLYNANGDIIGGGYSSLSLIPAGASSKASIPVVSSEYPTSAEVFASHWDYTQLQ